MQSPDEFRPENFKKKSTARDYVIYAVALILVVAVIGGTVYYFTRSEEEQAKLRAKLDTPLNDSAPPALPELKSSKAETLLAEEAAVAKIAERPEPKLVGVSTYSGGGPNRVVLSTDPKLPQAGLAFIQFAEALKVSSVVQGTTPKLMIGGKMYRAGEVIDVDQAVTFVGVDGVKSYIQLRDKSGAELSLSF
ncbi:MAG: hypothetical protein ACAH89_10505 [Rariglobus sp.]